MKPMRNFIICNLLIFTLFLVSCGNNNDETTSDVLVRVNGDRFAGGVFRLNESEYIKNLFPHNIVDVYSYRVASQIYEGLFRFDQGGNLKVIPALAEGYEVDSAFTIYTIKLRKGAFFHDDECFSNGKGREVKAEDIKYCFTRLCTQDRNNRAFDVFDGVLKGANAYYDATKGGKTPSFELEGIKIIDEYTIQLALEKPNSLFLTHLARPQTFIFPKEAFDKYGAEMRTKAVGTGPYKIATIDEDIKIKLVKNDKYYRKDKFGNQLPLINAIEINFIKDKKTELFEFRKGNLDMMYRLPTDYIIEILEETQVEEGGLSKYDLQREPEMQTQIFSFMNADGVFKDVNVRKAFSFAIDRKKILEFVLNGEGYEAGVHGLTPPSFPDYDISKIQGYDVNIDSAQYYLAKAGFPKGQNFPKITLDLNPEGDRHSNVALEIQKQLRDALNIQMEINILPHAQITDKCLKGNFSLIRLSWVADYPSPQNFLWMFHSKYVAALGDNSYPNIPRYKNEKFDELYEKGLTATSTIEANKFFMEAEKIAMKEAPILVLWYDECYRLLASRIKNFPNNPMQYRDFSEVYLMPVANPTDEEKSEDKVEN
jgi:peptide/nickel transport system substrate-binding protein